jgi:hypothetical protein
MLEVGMKYTVFTKIYSNAAVPERMGTACKRSRSKGGEKEKFSS